MSVIQYILRAKLQYTDIWVYIKSNMKMHNMKDVALQLKHVN